MCLIQRPRANVEGKIGANRPSRPSYVCAGRFDCSVGSSVSGSVRTVLVVMRARQSHLLVLGHPAGLAWVIANGQMAFNDGRLVQARKLQIDDRLLLYASMRALTKFRAKRGLLVGEASVSSQIRQLPEPVTVGTASYRHVVDFSLQRLAPLGEGIELAAHLDDLELFPEPKSWTSQIRRTVVPLSEHDASLLAARLAPIAVDPIHALEQYQQLMAPIDTRQPDRASREQAPTVSAPGPGSFILDLLAEL